MNEFQVVGWTVLLAFAAVAVVYCTVTDHDRIDDHRHVALQRKNWKEGKPYARPPAARLLDLWERLTRVWK